MKKVFICSPLKGNLKENIRKAKLYCKYVIACGYLPIAPHVYFTSFLNDTDPNEREMGMKLGLELLKDCDELWIFGNRITDGMKAETLLASQLEIKIIQKEMY